jgi:hypothetical protein
MFVSAIITIFLISFVWALFALKKVNSRPDVENVKKKLNKNRIIFQNQESS